MLKSNLNYSRLLGCDLLYHHIKRRQMSAQQVYLLNPCKRFEVVYFMYVNRYVYILCEYVLQKYSLLLKRPTADVLSQGSRYTAVYLEVVNSSIKHYM